MAATGIRQGEKSFNLFASISLPIELWVMPRGVVVVRWCVVKSGELRGGVVCSY